MCGVKFPARICLFILATGFDLVAHPIARADTPGYAITLLTVNGTAGSAANALNNAGVIVGGADGHAIQWSSAGLPTILADQGYTAEAYGISNAGQVVGNSIYAAKWLLNGTLIYLKTLGGNHDYARGINDAGQAVGYSLAADKFIFFPTIWSSAGTPTALDLPGNGSAGNAYAISIDNAGQIVGYGSIPSGVNHALEWSASGSVTDLGALFSAGNSDAYAINDAGQIVGDSQISAQGPLHAVEWSRDGTIKDLGVLPGGSNSQAFAINSSGEIVGDADVYIAGVGNREDAALWSSTGQIVDLNSLLPPDSGWYLLEATAINDRGQIAGIGFYYGQQYGFVLTPAHPP